MKLFRREARPPALTRDAIKLSDALLGLDEIGRHRAALTIGAIVSGISNLGAMPADVVDHLWSMLITVARKAIMGADPDKLMQEIQDGLHPEIRALIMEQVNR